MKNITIIGGGAAGLMSAYAAACCQNEHLAQLRHPKSKPLVSITILEKNDRVGRKLLATGNGRCNLTNLGANTDSFHGNNTAFAATALARCSPKKILSVFEQMGLLWQVEDEGRVYPRCGQASAVLSVLRQEMERLHMDVQTDSPVDGIIRNQKAKHPFQIACAGRMLSADCVILAAGGSAAPSFGSDGSGFALLEQLGHPVIPVHPALVPLRTSGRLAKSLQGIRLNATATLLSGEQSIADSSGEIQFTPYGLSGIPIMALSGRLADCKDASISLDLLPEISAPDLCSLLFARRDKLAHLTADKFLTGFFHKTLGPVLMKEAGVEKLSLPVSALSDQTLMRLAGLMKQFHMRITDTAGFAAAQTTRGGADTNYFDPATMESKKIPGFYAAGEVMDLYGDCGGYNLHWAWASGYLAGMSAMRSLL